MFAPALKAGAAFGGFFGFILHWIFPGFTAASGAYALVGMGALVAGTMHAPLTAMVIIFEISDTYQVILPITNGRLDLGPPVHRYRRRLTRPIGSAPAASGGVGSRFIP